MEDEQKTLSYLRRGPARVSASLNVADLELDSVRHRATRASRPLELTPKEFQLLALLLRRSGEVLSRTLIAEEVWYINFDSDSNVVEVHMRRLRSKVGGASQHVGLGLAVVKSIAMRHGGRVAIESEPGRGTHVVLLLPPR